MAREGFFPCYVSLFSEVFFTIDSVCSIPADTGDKMQYVAHEFNDNTIRFVLRYPGSLRAQTLEKAVRVLLERVPVLHASFRWDDAGAFWDVKEPVSGYFRTITVQDNPMPAAFAEAAQPIVPGNDIQLCCTLVQGKDSCAVVLRISHLCVDGSDGKYLLGKLTEACRMLEATGNCDGLELKNGSRAAEQVYSKMNRRQILSLCRSPMTGVKSVFRFASTEPGERRMLTRTIPVSVMNAVRKRAKKAAATANDLLLTACYHAYGELFGMQNEPLSVMSMMDLRRHCKDGESQGLSNLSGTLPTVLRNGLSADFADTLAAITAQTSALKNDPMAGLAGLPLLHGATRHLPLKILLAANRRLYKNMSLGMTNLGNLSGEAFTINGLAPDLGWFGGPLKKKPSVQVSVLSVDGVCTLSVVGEYTQADEQLLEEYLSRMVAALERYA